MPNSGRWFQGNERDGLCKGANDTQLERIFTTTRSVRINTFLVLSSSISTSELWTPFALALLVSGAGNYWAKGYEFHSSSIYFYTFDRPIVSRLYGERGAGQLRVAQGGRRCRLPSRYAVAKGVRISPIGFQITHSLGDASAGMGTLLMLKIRDGPEAQ